MSEKLSPIPGYADVMTIEDFAERVRTGLFIDYDGSGCYCKDGLESRDAVRPSTLDMAFAREHGYTHVAWYNR